MNCKHDWNREYIDLHLSRNFRSKEYRRHRENILFEREKLFFPETLGLMDKNQEQKKYCKEKISELMLERKKILQQLEEINGRLSNFRYHYNLLENSPTRTVDKFDVVVEKKTFIKKCVNQQCQGYINHKGHCLLCKFVICMQCHEPKQEASPHICKQENIDSVAQIKKETKNCPKCHIPIFKIDGCRQMWCTQCHTAFDWKTGEMIHYRIHNPHFYEWQKSQQENPPLVLDQLCNEQELPNLSRLRLYLSNKNIDLKIRKKLFDIHRSITHMMEVNMADLRTNMDNPFETNLFQRVSFLKSEITAEDFKNQLVLKENKMERNRNLFLLYDMVSKTILVFFNEIFHMNRFQIENELSAKLDSLLKYSNEQMGAHCFRFNVRRLLFHENFMVIRF